MHLCLGHSPLHGLREVGGFGQPLHLLYPQIRAVLSTALGEEAARLLAEPVADRAADRLDWYAEGDPDVPPVCLATIPEAQRGPMMDWINQVLTRGQSIADQYLASEDPRRAQLGAMLKAILQPPDPANVFLVDGKPVIIGWGFVTDQGWSITPATWTPTAAPLPIPTATVVSKSAPASTGLVATPAAGAEQAVVPEERVTVAHVSAPATEPVESPARPARTVGMDAVQGTTPPPPESPTPAPATATPPPPPVRRAGSPICCGLLMGLLLLLVLAGLIMAFYPPALPTLAHALLPPATEQERHWREQVAQLSDALEQARHQCAPAGTMGAPAGNTNTIGGNTNTIGRNTNTSSQNPTGRPPEQGVGAGLPRLPDDGQTPAATGDGLGHAPDRIRENTGHATSDEPSTPSDAQPLSASSHTAGIPEDASASPDPWQSGAQHHNAPLSPQRPTRQQQQTFTDRMNEAGAVIGEITATLLWENTSDLDLIIRCPSGHVLDYNKTEACGGRLDIDANNVRDQVTNKPVENAFWPTGKATPGAYQVAVRYVPRKDEQTPHAVPFQVRLIRGGRESMFKGTVTPHQATLVTTFEVGGGQ